MIRRYMAEMIGTFGIVFVPCALSATSKMTGGATGLMPAAVVSGLAVLAMVYALGPICGAHFNPAVSLGFAISKRFPWRYTIPYIGSQLVGGFLAACLVAALFGPGFGVHYPSSPDLWFRNLGLEIAITFMLMLVIMGVATDDRIEGAVPGVAIGTAVVFGVLIGGPVTGGSMNPARSIGPALFGGWHYVNALWLYVAGPCLGASIAAIAYESIRMRSQNAVSVPNDLPASIPTESEPVVAL